MTEVKYHITQYHCIIKELQEKVSYLQSRLDRQPSGGGGGAEGGAKKESSEVHSLCQQLKEFIQEEKEIRYMCRLYDTLLFNVFKSVRKKVLISLYGNTTTLHTPVHINVYA